ncbi:Mu transposase C-terminal domain-containing protein, partial [Novosphingobium sp.]|uniref:Mu transposase C-terminal domain-containing protein n=2 Tax=Bacteria TaxID=2 RepID=UPI0025D77363
RVHRGAARSERLFRTINTELLAELPGNLRNGKPVSPPRLTLPELDAAIGTYIVATYNVRPHRAIGVPPVDAWRGDGWLSRMPETLEELDALLVMVAKPRIVHRDGIRFEGLRYFNPTLAAYVGEPATIRYDPRDVGEVRIFHRNVFLCRAVSPDHAGLSITLKDVQAARIAYRRRLRSEIGERKARVADYLPAILRPLGSGSVRASTPKPTPATSPEVTRSKPRLRTYHEGSDGRRQRSRHQLHLDAGTSPLHRVANAVRKHRYIGCVTARPASAKPFRARRYARWDGAVDLLTTWGARQASDLKIYADLARARAVFLYADSRPQAARASSGPALPHRSGRYLYRSACPAQGSDRRFAPEAFRQTADRR